MILHSRKYQRLKAVTLILLFFLSKICLCGYNSSFYYSLSKKRNLKVETQLDKKEVNDKVPNWLNQIELNWINPVVHCVLLNQLNSNVLSVPLQFFCLIVSMLH